MSKYIAKVDGAPIFALPVVASDVLLFWLLFNALHMEHAVSATHISSVYYTGISSKIKFSRKKAHNSVYQPRFVANVAEPLTGGRKLKQIWHVRGSLLQEA